MSHSILIKYYNSPFGQLILGSYQGELCLCDWRYRSMRSKVDSRIQKALDANYLEGEDTCIDMAIDQLEAYSRGERKQFDVPLLLVGTDFQKSVWRALMEIPYGTTETYLELSRRLGDEKAIRAVASANGANGISILIPCHRVVGSDGSLVGYAGGTPVKKKLLELEGGLIDSQLSMFD